MSLRICHCLAARRRIKDAADATGRDELEFWLGATQIALKQPLQGLATLERLLRRNPRHIDALELTVRTANEVATGAWNRVAEIVFRYGEHFYNFQGLRDYKDKFDPVWEPKFLASPGGLWLPMILTNVTTLISGGAKGLVGK